MLVTLHTQFTISIEQLNLVTLNTICSVVTDEPFEFEEEPIHIQGFGKFTHPFRGKCQHETSFFPFINIILRLNKENLRDINMQPVGLGSRLIIPKFSPDTDPKYALTMK